MNVYESCSYLIPSQFSVSWWRSRCEKIALSV